MTCSAPEPEFFVVEPGDDDYPVCGKPAADDFLCPDHATPLTEETP